MSFLLVLTSVASFFFGLRLWKLSPSAPETTQRLSKKVLGHRGCRLPMRHPLLKSDPNFLRPPENTMSAFKFALDSGVDGLEMDIQPSKDGELFIFHDFGLKRLVKNLPEELKELKFSDLTSKQIRTLQVSQSGERAAEDSIPSLEEYLQWITEQQKLRGKKYYMMIELKVERWGPYHEMVDTLLTLVEKYPIMAENAVFGSFSCRALYYLRQKRPDLATMFLVPNSYVQDYLYSLPIWALFADPIFFLILVYVIPYVLEPSIIGFDWKVAGNKMELKSWPLERFGVNLWTVNGEFYKDQFLQLGCSVTTDFCFD